jgi:hypothetical protein
MSVRSSHEIANSLYCWGIGSSPVTEESLLEYYKFRKGKSYGILVGEAKSIVRGCSDANYAVKDITKLVEAHLKFKTLTIKFRVWFFGYWGAY